MKSVGIGLLGRNEGLMEGPKLWWGGADSCNRRSFEGEGNAFIYGPKIGGGKWPLWPTSSTSSTGSDDRDNSTDRRLP